MLLQGSLDVRMLSQQRGHGDVEDPDDTGAGATGENLLTGMEGNRARTIFGNKIEQLKERRD